jgi:toxin ParE1/3/4
MAAKVRISFRPRAERDLIALYEYIAAEAGLDIAGKYLDRIETACLALSTFPERGRKRDDIRPGIRVIGFERRASIVFLVAKSGVEIVRILYGGQDIEHVLDRL